MEYRVLGPLEVLDGERSLPLAGAKQRALLALLLLHANQMLSRDRLIDELWGEEPPETAVQSLHVYVSRLRKLLPSGTLADAPARLPARPRAGRARPAPLRTAARRGARGVRAGRRRHARRDVLHDALGLWRGPPLADLAFEPFAQAEIGRLEELRLAAVEERIEADLALGRHAELIGELEALVAENPLPRALRGQLMLALYRSGRQAEALEAYRDAARARRRARHRTERRATASSSRRSSSRTTTSTRRSTDVRAARRPRWSASWSLSSSPTWGWRTSSTRIPEHRGVSRRGPPRGAGRDRSGRRHGRERNRRRTDRDLRCTAGTR